jgi:cell division protein FtsB
VSEHLTKQNITAYQNGSLSAERLLQAFDHIAVCESCRKQIGEGLPVRASIENWQSDFTAVVPEHIAYEQLAAYVDKKVAGLERETIESHIKLCAECAQEARDLSAFGAEFGSAPPSESTVTSASPVAANPAPGFWQRVLAFWRTPRYWVPLQLAGTAAIIFLCVWVATNALRSDNKQLQSDLAKARQENEALQQEASATQNAVANLQEQLADLQQSQLQNLKPEEGNGLLVALNDGAGQITLDKAGNLTGLTALAPVYQQMVKTAILSERLQTPASLGNLVGKAGTLMGGSGEGVAFALLGPVGTSVATDRPTFRWREVKGASSYLVAVYDENFNWVATSHPITSSSWTTPNALERGATYFWQVSAIKDGREIKSPVPPAPEAKFRIIEQEKADELVKLKRSSANSHLAGGLIDAREGLLDDAEREFEALLQANPKSVIARKLLTNVKALRRSR